MVNHDGKVVISTALDNAGVQKGVNNISGSLGGLKSVLGNLGKVAAAAFSVRAIANFSAQAIKLGSDLEEVQNVVDVAFGSMKASAEDFASTAIKKFGMSELAAKKTSSQFMAMAKGLGVADAAASDMAISLAGLSGDAASFFNMDQDVVAKKLTGVFTGETEALKELGVVMTQTNLKQFAMERGMNANIEAMSQAEVVALRYAFVTDALSLAAGDFERTQNSWANQTRILSMQWQQFMGIIGQTLTTVLTPAIKLLNNLVSILITAAQKIQAVTSALFGKTAQQTQAVAESAIAGAAAQESFTEEVEASGKAAKKATAGFDELNILQNASAGSGGKTSGVAAGGGVPTAQTPATAGGDVQDALSPQIKAISDRIKEYIEPLKNIDFAPAKESLKGFGEEFSKFAGVVGDIFSWAWFNILVPLAEWSVEEAAPAGIGALSSAFKGLTATIKTIFSVLQTLWTNLQPIVSWIEETVLVVLEDLQEIGEKIAKKWEENGPKIEKTFENLGVVIQKIWSIIGPILTWIRDGLSQIAVDTPITDLQYIFDQLYGISEILAGIVTFDLGKVFNGFGALAEAELDRATSSMKTYAEALGIDTEAVDQKVRELGENIGKFFADAWEDVKGIWGNVSQWFQDNVITPIKDFFEPIGRWFGDLFGSIWATISDVFYNIGVIAGGCWEIIKRAWGLASSWFDRTVIQPISKYFSNLWSGFKSGAEKAWSGVKDVFGKVGSFFRDTFEKAWSGIVKVFSPIGEIFVDIKDGIVSAFKKIVNKLIEGINKVVKVPFDGINWALEKVRNVNILGIQPFLNLKTINVPKIPYLAQGAVLPPNKPFMAVVGDQRNGTNVEAPLATIQEALANVLAAQGIPEFKIEFVGELAQLARVLLPVIKQENNRVGTGLVKKAGA